MGHDRSLVRVDGIGRHCVAGRPRCGSKPKGKSQTCCNRLMIMGFDARKVGTSDYADAAQTAMSGHYRGRARKTV